MDLRQSSDKHEAVIAELLKVAKIEADYSALAEERRRELLLRLLNDARPLRVRAAEYTEHAQSELAIFEIALVMLQRYGRDALRHYIISHTEDVSDLLEVLLLMKEVGLTAPATTSKSFTVMKKLFDPANPEAYVQSFAIKRV